MMQTTLKKVCLEIKFGLKNQVDVKGVDISGFLFPMRNLITLE